MRQPKFYLPRQPQAAAQPHGFQHPPPSQLLESTRGQTYSRRTRGEGCRKHKGGSPLLNAASHQSRQPPKLKRSVAEKVRLYPPYWDWWVKVLILSLKWPYLSSYFIWSSYLILIKEEHGLQSQFSFTIIFSTRHEHMKLDLIGNNRLLQWLIGWPNNFEIDGCSHMYT